jgi:hypothetical protein
MGNAKGNINNPTGKGGFVDNPQNKADGRWKKEDSFSYCLNYFKSLSVEQFLKWGKNTPKKKRTVAMDLAYNRVFNAREDLKEFQEVANRTEGKPVQPLANPDGSNLEFPVVYLPKEETDDDMES